jgi:hypothetical protein
MKVEGQCHCGEIAFEAEIDPNKVEICHCLDCQILSGTAFRITAPAARDRFKLLSGNPQTYVKVADSGIERALTFCPTCGASIYSTYAGDPSADYSIRVGTLTQRDRLEPKRQIWTHRALYWLSTIEDIQKINEQ